MALSDYVIMPATDYIAICDIIREKIGSTELIKSGEIINHIAAIAGSGLTGDETLTALIDGTITGISDNTATIVQLYKFFQCDKLLTANFPAAITIGGYAFQGCTLLHTINAPNVTMIGIYGLSNTKIETANFPEMITVNNYAFADCLNLTTVNLPKAEEVLDYAFRNCKSLMTLNLPKVNTITSSMLVNCSALTLVDLGAATSIAKNAFQNCSTLQTLILRDTSQVCSLANINVFSGTPFANGGNGGTVYVPATLIDSYKTASNWSTLYGYGTCNFIAIEGSEYEIAE